MSRRAYDELEDDLEESDFEEQDLDEPVARGWASGDRAAPSERGLALGFLAMLPLFAAYELGVMAEPAASRNTSELVLWRVGELFGPSADPLRRGLLIGLAVWALVAAFRRDLGLLPRLARIVVEGAAAALVLGPLLLGLVFLVGVPPTPPELQSAAPLAAPSLARAARVLGGAAYEEIAFRLGLFSAFYFLLRWIVGFLVGTRAGPTGRLSTGLALPCELLAAVLSAVAFAAFHLAPFTAWLGPGGEPFALAVFTWRWLAGMLLVGLFRWRGLGVAAWAHGLFNLALFLGAGPDVFLAGPVPP